jgi:hypothetical protein
MQPTFFSRKARAKKGKAWHQAGFDIDYEESEFRGQIHEYNSSLRQKPWMQLSFSYNFKHGGDEVFCCYTIPYSYTEMQVHINQLKMMKDEVIKVDSVGKSIGGLNIPVLKFSSKPNLPIIMIIGR